MDFLQKHFNRRRVFCFRAPLALALITEKRPKTYFTKNPRKNDLGLAGSSEVGC
jgi:hypothetical protein